MRAALQLQAVSKAYGPVPAVNDVTLSVGRGELVGLVGPDGAGKTTLMRMVCTLLLPDRGSIEVLGFDTRTGYAEIRRRIGYMPGRFSLYMDLSVEENLRFYATIFQVSFTAGLQRVEPIYRMLAPFRDRRAGALSGGMKQKLALCCALIHEPELLVLDEPTTGVDAVSRKEFWDVLDGVKGSGIPILVSTPYMDEATRCDRVVLLQHGQVLGLDAPGALAASFPYPLLGVSHPDKYRLLQLLRTWDGAVSVYPFGDSVHVAATTGAQTGQLQAFLSAAGLNQVRIIHVAPGVEDVFLHRMSGGDHG